MDLRKPVTLRMLTLKDVDMVVEIDESLLGAKRRGYWERRLEQIETSGVPSLAAEIDGKVVGFVLGDASGWEFGIPQNIAWIDTICVRKEYQRQGIAKLLFREMASMFKKIGIDVIYTFVNQKDSEFLQFCDKMGLKKGDMINLEMKI